MGLMENKLPRLMESSRTATTIIQRSDLIAGAATEEANKWIPPSTDLRYIINIFTGASAGNGFEIFRQLSIRCSVPLRTKSICYCTMGVWAQQVRTWQRTSTTKIRQNCSHTEWDKTDRYTRASTLRTSTNICKSEDNKYEVSTEEPQEHLQNSNGSRQA